ncbi:MAG: hypothetical protein V1494_06130 [Candidatus Diapherotrites archaeon]
MTLMRETKRKLFHAVLGTIFLLAAAFIERQLLLLAVAAIFLTGIIISWFVKRGANIPAINFFVQKFGREKEKHFPGYGALYFLLGFFLLVFLFPGQEIVFGALLVSVYGDTISTIAGKAIGRIKTVAPYTLEGTIAGIIVSAALLAQLFPLSAAIIVAVIGMLAEYLPVDDNLMIPLVCAAALTILI